MKQSLLFGKTIKEAPKEEVSISSKLLIRGGFIDKLASGIFTYLPLGLRVLEKIKIIIRAEMNSIGAQEILMPALTPKENWLKTNRWNDPGSEVMFQFNGRGEKSYGLAWTHEEIITPLVRKYVNSYRDLPLAVYHIQDKFRNEPRAKSGLLRGREFSMKDLYSFHADENDLNCYYEKVKKAYLDIFKKMDLKVRVVEASGGSFSKYSHEFQLFSSSGEDTIYFCDICEFAQNSEISKLKSGDSCSQCGGGKILSAKAIEVGNIFKLKTKYTDDFMVSYKDQNDKQNKVYMGCYGLGPSRMMGALVEIHNDSHGIIWPKSVSPYDVHLLQIGKDESIAAFAIKTYNALQKGGVDVLFDEREAAPGIKFSDSDLLGIPIRAVVSRKTGDKIEFKMRTNTGTSLESIDSLIKKINVQ